MLNDVALRQFAVEPGGPRGALSRSGGSHARATLGASSSSTATTRPENVFNDQRALQEGGSFADCGDQSCTRQQIDSKKSSVVRDMRVTGKSSFPDFRSVQGKKHQATNMARSFSVPLATDSDKSDSSIPSSVCSAQWKMMVGDSSGNSDSSLIVRHPPKEQPPSTGPMLGTPVSSDDSRIRDSCTSSPSDVCTSDSNQSCDQQHAEAALPHDAAPQAVDGDMLSRVPRDHNGELMSVGSIGHSAGTCQPCCFMRGPGGCKYGIRCFGCHFPHRRKRQNKDRPCKGKRERQKKAMSRTLREFDNDPDAFDLNNMDMPISLQSSQLLQDRLRNELRRRDASVRRRRLEQDASDPTARSSFHPADPSVPRGSTTRIRL